VLKPASKIEPKPKVEAKSIPATKPLAKVAAKPVELPKPVAVLKPVVKTQPKVEVPKKPIIVVAPIVQPTPKPVAAQKPAAKPVESPKVVEVSKPVVKAQPKVDVPKKPAVVVTPIVPPISKPVVAQKPAAKSIEPPKPVEVPKAVAKVQPKVEVTKKSAAVVTPVAQPISKPIAVQKPAAKVVETPKPVAVPKPVAIAQPKVEAPKKPAAVIVPVAQPISTPTSAPKTVVKPVEPPKAVEKPKPVAIAQPKVEAPKKVTAVVAPVAQPVVAPVPGKKTAAKAKSAKIAIPAILLEGDQSPMPAGPHGPGQRYALGPMTPPAHLSGGETGELPEAYGTQRLFLAARDPQWIYANWDLTRDQQKQYNKLSRDGHLVLRVFLNNLGNVPVVEQHVHPESRNWFLYVGKGGMRYLAELGYFDAQDTWISISQSGATMTPPDSLSEDTSVRFATLPVEIPFYQLLEFVKEAAMEHLPLAEAIREVAKERLEEIQFPFYPAKTAPGITPGATSFVPGSAPTPLWTPEQEKALGQLVTMDTVRRVWIGSLEITELIRRHLMRGISSAGAAELSLPAGALGALGSVTSPFGGEVQKGKGKGFWFNVNAELIIYGATEPDAEVIIAGRAIQLRKDGTFSYRFALPDGQFDLPITATAADKTDARAAALKFSRHTDYLGDVGTHPQDAALKPPLPENVA
jgi:hypothetical protein